MGFLQFFQGTTYNLPPTVTLAVDLVSGYAPVTINLLASPSSAYSSIAQVEFFNGTTSLGVLTAAPWTVPFTAQPDTNYSFTAAVTDATGTASTSALVSAHYELIPSAGTPILNTGPWRPNNLYHTNDLVYVGKIAYYRIGPTFTSGATFDAASWQVFADVTKSYVDAADALLQASLTETRGWIGTLGNLYTTAKGSLVAALNELRALLDMKADLVGGRVPLTQLPDGLLPDVTKVYVDNADGSLRGGIQTVSNSLVTTQATVNGQGQRLTTLETTTVRTVNNLSPDAGGNVNTPTGTGGTGAPTNLLATATDTQISLSSSTGSGAIIPSADFNKAGLLLPEEKSKLANLSNYDAVPLTARVQSTEAVANAQRGRLDLILAGSDPAFDVFKELSDQIKADETGTAAILATQQQHTREIALRAPSADPSLTGNARAQTPPQTANDDRIATTNYVRLAIQPSQIEVRQNVYYFNSPFPVYTGVYIDLALESLSNFETSGRFGFITVRRQTEAMRRNCILTDGSVLGGVGGPTINGGGFQLDLKAGAIVRDITCENMNFKFSPANGYTSPEPGRLQSTWVLGNTVLNAPVGSKGVLDSCRINDSVRYTGGGTFILLGSTPRPLDSQIEAGTTVLMAATANSGAHTAPSYIGEDDTANTLTVKISDDYRFSEFEVSTNLDNASPTIMPVIAGLVSGNNIVVGVGNLSRPAGSIGVRNRSGTGKAQSNWVTNMNAFTATVAASKLQTFTEPGWSHYTQGGGGANWLAEDTETLRIEIVNQGNGNNAVQLRNNEGVLINGNSYRMTFRAKALFATQIQVLSELSQPPYSGLGFPNINISLTDVYTDLSFEFTVVNATNTAVDGLPTFYLGAQAGQTFWFQGVQVIQLP